MVSSWNVFANWMKPSKLFTRLSSLIDRGPRTRSERVIVGNEQNLRKSGEREVLVVLNLSGQNDLHFELNDARVTGRFTNVFSGAANDFTKASPFEMQAWEYLVYEK